MLQLLIYPNACFGTKAGIVPYRADVALVNYADSWFPTPPEPQRSSKPKLSALPCPLAACDGRCECDDVGSHLAHT